MYNNPETQQPSNQQLQGLDIESPSESPSESGKGCWYWFTVSTSVVLAIILIMLFLLISFDKEFKKQAAEFLISFQHLSFGSAAILITSEVIYIVAGFSGTGIEVLFAFGLKSAKQTLCICLISRTLGYLATFFIANRIFRQAILRWLRTISHYKSMRLLCEQRPWTMCILLRVAPLPRQFHNYGLPLLGLPLIPLYITTILTSLPWMIWSIYTGLTIRSWNDADEVIWTGSLGVQLLFVGLVLYGFVSCLIAARIYKKFCEDLERRNQNETQQFLRQND